MPWRSAQAPNSDSAPGAPPLKRMQSVGFIAEMIPPIPKASAAEGFSDEPELILASSRDDVRVIKMSRATCRANVTRVAMEMTYAADDDGPSCCGWSSRCLVVRRACRRRHVARDRIDR